MNNRHKKAEAMLKQAVKSLSHLIGEDGEDLRCYRHYALNGIIANLIDAQVNMALGEELHGSK